MVQMLPSPPSEQITGDHEDVTLDVFDLVIMLPMLQAQKNILHMIVDLLDRHAPAKIAPQRRHEGWLNV
jgi:hypothetical protein